MLISTADLRTWLALEEGDKKPNDKLEALAKAVEDFVNSITNRQLAATYYNADVQYSYFDGTGKNYIYTYQYPISYVAGVYVDADRVFASASMIASDDIFWYPSGKIISEGGYFFKGHRNVKIDYKAGFAPVVGGTCNTAIGSYPLPNDLKQVMVEMAVEAMKEGKTAVHTIAATEAMPGRFINMLSSNSFWRNTINKYKAFDAALQGNEE